MVKPWNLCRTLGPLLSHRFLLASAKAQPRGGFLISRETYVPVRKPKFKVYHLSDNPWVSSRKHCSKIWGSITIFWVSQKSGNPVITYLQRAQWYHVCACTIAESDRAVPEHYNYNDAFQLKLRLLYWDIDFFAIMISLFTKMVVSPLKIMVPFSIWNHRWKVLNSSMNNKYD